MWKVVKTSQKVTHERFEPRERFGIVPTSQYSNLWRLLPWKIDILFEKIRIFKRIFRVFWKLKKKIKDIFHFVSNFMKFVLVWFKSFSFPQSRSGLSSDRSTFLKVNTQQIKIIWSKIAMKKSHWSFFWRSWHGEGGRRVTKINPFLWLFLIALIYI